MFEVERRPLSALPFAIDGASRARSIRRSDYRNNSNNSTSFATLQIEKPSAESMTGIPRKLSLFFALLALLSLLFPDVIGQPGTVVSIPFTAPTSTGSYSVCHCMNVTWTSNVGAGDFSRFQRGRPDAPTHRV